MAQPQVSIAFSEVAATAIKRGERGIIAMVLKETAAPTTNPFECVSELDIPASLSDAGKTQIKLALKGYINTPRKVIVYIVTGADYTNALNYFSTVKFNYLVCPSVATDEQESTIVSYVAAQRNAKKLIKAVLPNNNADKEYIINVTTTSFIEGSTTYTTEQYCSRIAGIIAGTPLYMSATYCPLMELTDCTRLTSAQADAAEEAGQFIAFWDGEKVKMGRAVNSLVTLTSQKNTQFQKIKLVDAMDMISDDIRMTAEDSYIGKYANTYDNKCLLISAIGNYFAVLIREQVLSAATIGIDIEANRSYLAGRGVKVDEMSEQEIKEANTGSAVYLVAQLSLVDAIEDIYLPISI